MIRTAIIDLDSVLFAAAWGKKIPNGEGDYLRDEKGRLVYKDKSQEEIMESVDNILTDILDNTKATHYIAFVKGKSTGEHRYQAKSDYKANRPKESPTWWQFTKDYVISSWGAVETNIIEVDDAVSITAKSLSHGFIVAIDKDLLHLEGTHYNWRTGEWISNGFEDSVIYFWEDMIAGQPGDGIQGIPGKGKAYFKKLLKEFEWHQLYSKVFEEYYNYFGEDKGIKEFYKNYTCLKILEEFEGFEIPEPIEYKLKEEQTSLWQE